MILLRERFIFFSCVLMEHFQLHNIIAVYRTFHCPLWTLLLMGFKITQTLYLTAKLAKFALVGNLICQEGRNAAVVVGKQSSYACRTLTERAPAVLADDVT